MKKNSTISPSTRSTQSYNPLNPPLLRVRHAKSPLVKGEDGGCYANYEFSCEQNYYEKCILFNRDRQDEQDILSFIFAHERHKNC